MKANIEKLDKAKIEITSPMILKWGVKTIGFGEFYFYQGIDGKIHCMNECMSKEFVKKVLNDMIDDCIMDE